MATITPEPPMVTQSSSRWRGVLRTARPKQWLKNVLVLAAPAAAGVLTQPRAVFATALAFVAFCLAASGTYLINDARDAEADRNHHRKRFRPVAAGIVPIPLAYALGIACLLGAVLVALPTGWELPVTVAIYVALTTVYSLVLKHIVILDMVGVAAGFVLRAVAGAAAVQVEVSSWFLIVASLGSLFIVAGKREAELRSTSGGSRSTLEHYTPQFLWYVRASSSGALLVSYCLWALDKHDGASALAFGLSIVPFATGVLRYAMLIESGEGEAPEELVLSDRLLLGSGLLVALALAVGVYVVA